MYGMGATDTRSNNKRGMNLNQMINWEKINDMKVRNWYIFFLTDTW
jgi:hypothetical protein